RLGLSFAGSMMRMARPAPQHVGKHLRFVPFAFAGREQERDASAVSLDVEEQIQELCVVIELTCVALLELRPAFDLMVVPPAQLGARSDVTQPQVEPCRGLTQ